LSSWCSPVEDKVVVNEIAENLSLPVGISNLHATAAQVRADCAMCLMAKGFAPLHTFPYGAAAVAPLLTQQQHLRMLAANPAVRRPAAAMRAPRCMPKAPAESSTWARRATPRGAWHGPC
jgi:hypothetical protein